MFVVDVGVDVVVCVAGLITIIILPLRTDKNSSLTSRVNTDNSLT